MFTFDDSRDAHSLKSVGRVDQLKDLGKIIFFLQLCLAVILVSNCICCATVKPITQNNIENNKDSMQKIRKTPEEFMWSQSMSTGTRSKVSL